MKTRTVALWLEWGSLRWLEDNVPGHPVADSLNAAFVCRLTAFGAARDLGQDEVLPVLHHEALSLLGIGGDPLPPLPRHRRPRRRGGRRGRKQQ